MAYRVSAVLAEAELMLFTDPFEGLGGVRLNCQVFASDMSAIQAMYLSGLPDLLVIDLSLPTVGGFPTLSALRSEAAFRDLRVLVLTEEGMNVEASTGRRTIVLTKPVRRNQLESSLVHLLSNLPAEAAPRNVPPGPPAPGLVERQTDDGSASWDLRRAPRRSLQTACLISGGGQKLRGVLRDISLTGAQVALQEELPHKIMVSLRVGVPGTVPLKIVEFKARVVRKTRVGYGIVFLEMNPETRRFLLAYTQAALGSPPPPNP
jgi:CheY-like chemotaxis protein